MSGVLALDAPALPPASPAEQPAAPAALPLFGGRLPPPWFLVFLMIVLPIYYWMITHPR